MSVVWVRAILLGAGRQFSRTCSAFGLALGLCYFPDVVAILEWTQEAEREDAAESAAPTRPPEPVGPPAWHPERLPSAGLNDTELEFLVQLDAQSGWKLT